MGAASVSSAEAKAISASRAGVRPGALPVAWALGARYAGVSAALLAPCFWHSRIQAGDLSSHLYNAWLARLAAEGNLKGLAVVPQWTNVLFDAMLRGLLGSLDARWAERVAVVLCVLVFFWGAFALVSALAGRKPWHLAPCLALAAYGWTFHMGFFNFYLSLGLCFWALALSYKGGARRLGAWLLLIPATLAHALPAAWALALGLYIAWARKLAPRWRPALAAGALAGILGLRLWLSSTYETLWSFRQLAAATGADQAWVYDRKYFFAFLGLLAVLGLLFVRLLNHRGRLRTILGIPFQIALLTAAGVFLIPNFIWFPAHTLALQFLDERMSLAMVVLACAVVGAAPARRLERAPIPALAALFFALLYADGRALNRLEDQVTRVVRTVPPGARVVSALCARGSRVDPLRHMVDRACLGWCFSYGNYEPASGQFSLRAFAPNGVVLSERGAGWALEHGRYLVKPKDLPLYQIERAGSGAVRVRALAAGQTAGENACWSVL
jgi:hypothetical protein